MSELNIVEFLVAVTGIWLVATVVCWASGMQTHYGVLWLWCFLAVFIVGTVSHVSSFFAARLSSGNGKRKKGAGAKNEMTR